MANEMGSHSFVELYQGVMVPMDDSPLASPAYQSENGPHLVERMVSSASHYSDCNSDITSDDYDYDDDYYNEGEVGSL